MDPMSRMSNEWFIMPSAVLQDIKSEEPVESISKGAMRGEKILPALESIRQLIHEHLNALAIS